MVRSGWRHFWLLTYQPTRHWPQSVAHKACQLDSERTKSLSPVMASAVFFLDLKGKTLLARNYRGDIPMSAVDRFMPLLMDAEEENTAAPPCISHEGVNVSFPLPQCR